MTTEDLQQYCLSLPGATEDVKYGSDLCFSVCGKIFCGTRITGEFRTGLKCTEEAFADLTERDGIVPMPRLAVTHWIRIEKSNALTQKEWRQYIQASYQLVVTGLSKKKQAALMTKRM
jgi:predicted DNA-binding protein (MmcQ/YjbR family)